MLYLLPNCCAMAASSRPLASTPPNWASTASECHDVAMESKLPMADELVGPPGEEVHPARAREVRNAVANRIRPRMAFADQDGLKTLAEDGSPGCAGRRFSWRKGKLLSTLGPRRRHRQPFMQRAHGMPRMASLR